LKQLQDQVEREEGCMHMVRPSPFLKLMLPCRLGPGKRYVKKLCYQQGMRTNSASGNAFDYLTPTDV
jgi:hypothetical protein